MMPLMMQTPNRAMLSIIGLYNWSDRIFDNLHLPDGVDPEEVKLNILSECGELTIMYPDWDFMYKAIDFWSNKELPTWERVYTLTQLEYNPIENYDRIESEIESEAALENRLRSSQNTRSQSGESTTGENSQTHTATNSASLGQNSNVNKVAGFNTDSMADQSATAGNTQNTDVAKGDTVASTDQTMTTSGEETDVGNSSDQGETNRNRSRSSRIHGNIGVSTPADMMAKELEIYPAINIVEYIVNSFKRRFCILVY